VLSPAIAPMAMAQLRRHLRALSADVERLQEENRELKARGARGVFVFECVCGQGAVCKQGAEGM